MLDRVALVKRKLNEAMAQLCQVSWMFSKQPGKDFSRTKKLPFSKVVSFLPAMEGGTLTNELLKYFGCSVETPSASAFVQQRSKLAPETLPALFDLFVQKTQPTGSYKGFRLLAADGSDILIPNNMAHIQEKNWMYVIRVKDAGQTRGIAAGLTLPKAEEFDVLIDLSLTTKKTNEVKELFKHKNKYRGTA